MPRRTRPTRRLRSLVLALTLAAMAFGASACEIEGGVARPTEVPASPSAPAPEAVTPSPAPTSAAVAQALAARRSTWVVGVLEQPPDLYPYPASAPARRILAPVSELIFPSPVLAYGFSYTGTGVLERIPSLANGDAKLIRADVHLDAAGNITTTATEVVTQVDQLEITFRWNPKLTWSDGTPVTADDSVFAYELARQSPPGDDARLLVGQIDRYEAVDAHTTRALLRPDVTGWTYFMSFWTPLPRHLLAGVPPDKVRESDFAKRPVGYGPYMIESVLPGEIRMVRNPHYYGPPPPAERVTVATLRDLDSARANLANGNLDVVATDRVGPEQLPLLQRAAQDGLGVAYVASPIWEHIDLNLDVPTLQDIRVRRAIALGTNRAAMVKALYDGQSPVIESWVLPGQAEAAPLDQITRYPYDPDQARKLLDEAGYVESAPGAVRASTTQTLTLQLFTSEGAVRKKVAELFQADMKAIGVEVEIVTLSNQELFAPDGPLFQRQFELALYAWIASPDPGGLQMWSCPAVPSEGNGWSGENFAGWCFRDADRAIREATTTLDAAKRREAYIKQQQLWTQELPSLPLFQRASVVLSAPGVQGLQPDSLAPVTWNITSWRRAP